MSHLLSETVSLVALLSETCQELSLYASKEGLFRYYLLLPESSDNFLTFWPVTC